MRLLGTAITQRDSSMSNGSEFVCSHSKGGWLKSEWARHTWECVAPIHIRGYCPHPSNHLRRRIHQPSLLPHNIHRNACAVQDGFWKTNGMLMIAKRNE